jgi:hypothetical protein
MISTYNTRRIAVKALLSGGMALAAVGLASGIAQANDDHHQITPSHPPIYAPVHANPHSWMPNPDGPGGDIEVNPVLSNPDSRR